MSKQVIKFVNKVMLEVANRFCDDEKQCKDAFPDCDRIANNIEFLKDEF